MNQQLVIVDSDPVDQILSAFTEEQQDVLAFLAPKDDQGNRDPDMVKTIEVLTMHLPYAPGDARLPAIRQEQGEYISLRLEGIASWLEVTKFYMGFLLKIMEDQPEIYQAMGYTSFDLWIMSLSGLSKSVADEVLLRARVWPFMRQCGYTLLTFLEEFTDFNKVRTIYAIKKGMDAQIIEKKKALFNEQFPGLTEARIPLPERNHLTLQAQQECVSEVSEQIEQVRLLSYADMYKETREKLGVPEPLYIELPVTWENGMLRWKAGITPCGKGQAASMVKANVTLKFRTDDGRVLTVHDFGTELGMIIVDNDDDE